MSESMDMNCAEMAEASAELALGVLTGRERADAVAHLSRCDGCREDVRQLMETGSGLLGLLPPVEPPPGFETRVLDRLGLPPSMAQQRPAVPPSRDARSPQPGSRRPSGPQAPPRRRGRRRQGASRSRRLFAAGAITLAIAGAGLGGWGLGMGIGAASRPSQVSTSQIPLESAVLRAASGSHPSVGQVFYYQGDPEWLYMSVDLPTGNGQVICQVVNMDGKTSDVGSFKLNDGYGFWGTPNPETGSELREARLVSENGTLLATATLG
jgi:hypothetical protein